MYGMTKQSDCYPQRATFFRFSKVTNQSHRTTALQWLGLDFDITSAFLYCLLLVVAAVAVAVAVATVATVDAAVTVTVAVSVDLSWCHICV